MLQHTKVIKFACASLVALGLSLATGKAKAATTTIAYSGSNCRPTKASINFVDYNAFSIFGLGSAAFTPAQVTCPLPVPYTAGGLPGTLNSVKLVVLDRNDGSTPGAIKDFSCTIFYQNSAGTTFTGASLSPNLFSIPNALSFTLNQNTTVAGATMICSLPDPQGGSSFSHILNYSVTTTS